MKLTEDLKGVSAKTLARILSGSLEERKFILRSYHENQRAAEHLLKWDIHEHYNQQCERLAKQRKALVLVYYKPSSGKSLKLCWSQVNITYYVE